MATNENSEFKGNTSIEHMSTPLNDNERVKKDGTFSTKVSRCEGRVGRGRRQRRERMAAADVVAVFVFTFEKL